MWKAHDRITGASRIIKIGEGVKREAVLSRTLVHPLVGYAYDCGVDPNYGDYSVYPEFCGKNVLDWVTQTPNAPVKHFAAKASEFLCFLHHEGWLYNDFKPEHFVITESGLKVIDLGLCTPLTNGRSSGTFSGTFPYISPERLNGRPYDQRSDIFALGVLLLQMLLPDEPLPVDPSINALNGVLYNVRKLKEPWKKLIAQMTALEPSQRISSAQELWKKLQAGKDKVPAVQLPVRTSVCIPPELLDQKMLFVHAPSDEILEGAHSRILIHAWENNEPVFSFHCKDILPEKSFEKLCVALTNRVPESACSLLEVLKNCQRKATTIIYRAPEVLNSEQKAMLFFGISCLSEFEWLKIVLLSMESSNLSLTGSWKKYQIPIPKGQSWNTFSVESMDPARKKILNALAVSGGSLPLDALDSSPDGVIIRALAQQGLISATGGKISLVLTLETLLSRMRKSQKRSLANRILNRFRNAIGPVALFHLAVHAESKDLAARAALLNAETKDPNQNTTQKMEWYWNAFYYGAPLEKSTLYLMAKFYLRRGNSKRVRPILHYISKQFGKSFRFANLYLDYFKRQSLFGSAVKIADRAMTVATRKQNIPAYHYFRARRVALFVLGDNYGAAKEEISQLQDCGNRTIRSLIHHSRGMLFFHYGQLNEALNEFHQCCKFRNALRSNGMMNVGIVLGRMGRFSEAQICLEKALRMFSKTEDQENLSRIFLNLGMNFYTAGDVTRARKNYFRSLHLSRVCRCHKIQVISLNNLAVTYEMQGRNERAISILRKVYRLSRRYHLKAHEALGLCNIGLHLAYRGQFRKSISTLKEVIRLRSGLKLKLQQARAQEYLATSYLLSFHFNSAESALLSAEQLYSGSECEVDLTRIHLMLALVYSCKKQFQKAGHILDSISVALPNSYELGFGFYVRAVQATQLGDPRALEYAQEAERIFRKVPSLFWLAKTFKLKSEIYRDRQHLGKSLLYMQACYHLFFRMGCNHELRNLPREGKSMQIYQDFLDRLADRLPYKALQMIREILSMEDVDSMVQKILQTGLELTGMDRAMLLLNDDPPRVFRSASLEGENVDEIMDVSRSVLDQATDSGKPVVCLDASSDPLLQNRPSILNNRILSVVCIPLRGMNSRPVGCLYLDSREGVEALEGTEKVMLEIFSAIIGLALNQSLLLEKSVRENRKLKDWLELSKDSPEMIGSSSALMNVLKTVQKVANHNLPILITGETGTGKELVARMIHYSSSRKKGPFVAVNCAAFSRDLLESELFGHEKGSFTGAIQQKRGLFEAATDGTLMLDEIGEMPLEMQPKLLRVLQDGEFRRIGSTHSLKTNARIVLATNRNIDEMVGEGKFREDLLYRIKVLEIHLPPLRERSEDIPLLATAFLKQAMLACDKNLLGFTPTALKALKSYSWPGNVRQLKSEIERSVALAETEWIDASDLDERIGKISAHPETKVEMSGSLAETEKRLIQQRLEEHNWNVASAAKSLGITRHGLYSKMRRYNVSNPNK